MEHIQIPKTVNYELSDELLEFCERNGISETDINNIANSELAKNASRRDFNPILIDCPVKCPTSLYDEIYIRDIIGEMPNEKFGNLLESLNETYKSHKEPLKMSKDEMIKAIQSTFDKDHIYLSEVKYGKYMVGDNGRHRVTMLRFLYIDEVLKGEKPIEEINEKYSIKAEIQNYDLTLTYMYFLLANTGAINAISPVDSKISQGKPIYKVKFANGEEKILSKDQIIFDFNRLYESTKSNMSEGSLYRIEGYAKMIPSLNSFLKVYVPELAQKNEFGSL